MFDFTFFASGYFCLCGQVPTNVIKFYSTKFKPGDIAYDCEEATQHGKLIKILITNVDFIFSYKTGPSAPTIVYQDNLNGTWVERLLCSHQEAVTKAIVYWSNLLADAVAVNNKLNPSCRNR